MTPTPMPPGERDRAAGRWIHDGLDLRAPHYYNAHRISSNDLLSTAAKIKARRLRRYRQAIDTWDRLNGCYAMPKPVDYGLALGDLRPSEVAW